MREAPQDWPVVVVGAGAAGLLAALFAARGGAPVLLVETRPKPGAKIRVSGGGRCNVMPSAMSLDDYATSGSRNTLRNILFSWPLADVRRFFEHELAIPMKTEATGKVFPVSEEPLEIVDALLDACARAGVTLTGSFRVAQIVRTHGVRGPCFEVEAADGRRVLAQRLVLATGGLSLPKTGSDGAGLDFAQRLGIATLPTYPALVPLVTSDARWTALAGISVRAQLRAVRGDRVVGESERELLFTHRGFSGPVVLDMSRHVTAPDAAGLRLLVRWGGVREPSWEDALRASSKRLVSTVLSERLPERLADALRAAADVKRERREHELQRAERLRLLSMLNAFVLPVGASEGYAKAEVTAGGIALSEIHARTLECRAAPGLFACGEILDVVGRIGGFNFLWAWTSGRRAGESAAASLRAE